MAGIRPYYWLFAVILSTIVIHNVREPWASWTTVILISAALDLTDGLSWKPWWKTAVRALLTLGVCTALL
jgi:hypothetical protein